ncbi:MAG: hypothetical protein R2857_15620 [Vampirovibrionales bacterium]
MTTAAATDSVAVSSNGAYTGEGRETPKNWLMNDVIDWAATHHHADTTDATSNGTDDHSRDSRFRQTTGPVMVAHLIQFWFDRQTGFPRNYEGDTGDLTQRLQDLISNHRHQFTRITRIPSVLEDRLAHVSMRNVRMALGLLDATGHLTFQYHTGDSGPFTLSRPALSSPPPNGSAGQNGPADDTLEAILLSNASWSDRALLELMNDFETGRLRPHQEISRNFYIGGRPISPQVRTRVMQRANRLGLVRKEVRHDHTFDGPTDTVFLANDPTAVPNDPAAVPPIVVPHSNERIVLTYLLSDPSHRLPMAVLPAANRLSTLYGGSDDNIRGAALRLVKAGILSSSRQSGSALFSPRTPVSAPVLVEALRQTFPKSNRLTEDTLLKLATVNDSQPSPTTFEDLRALQHFIPFRPDDTQAMSDAAQHAKARHVLFNMACEAPIRLMGTDWQGAHRQSWLNPAVDYALLGQTLQGLQTNVETLGLASYIGMTAWQLPKLYEPLTHVQPCLWIKPTRTDAQKPAYRVQYGLVSSDGHHPFTPLHALNDSPDEPEKPDPKAGKTAALPNPMAFNPHRFARYYLDKLLAFYPLDAMDALEDNPSVLITPEQAQVLSTYSRHFRAAGYQVNL